MYSLPLTTAPPTSCVGCGYGAKFCQCPSGYCADVIVVAATTATADTSHFIERLRNRNRIETSFGNHSPVARAFKARATGDCDLPSFGYGSRDGRLHLPLHLFRELAEWRDCAPMRRREPLDVQLEFFHPRVERGV